MNRKRFILPALLVLLVTAAALFMRCNSPEQQVLRTFHSNRAAFDADIAATIENGRPTGTMDVTFNYWEGEHPIQEYILRRDGLVPSGRYYGVFYSFDGVPVAFQNAAVPLAVQGSDAWTWEAEGDNRGTVRRLDGNWFYFEARF